MSAKTQKTFEAMIHGLMKVFQGMARALRGSFRILNPSLITPLRPTNLRATPWKTKRKLLRQLAKRISDYRR